MMRNTASIQVNLDLGEPGDDRRAAGTRAHDLGPVLAAVFANSPFDASGRPDRLPLDALAVWHAIDPARTDSAAATAAAPRATRGRATRSTRR